MKFCSLFFGVSKLCGIVRRSGWRREYLTGKTHDVGAGGEKQAEKTKLKAGG